MGELMISIRRLMVVLLLVILGGCSGVQVSHDYDPGADFRRLRTYALQDPVPEESRDYRETSPLLHKRIKRAITVELRQRGYRPAEAADFYVSYSYTRERQVESTPHSPFLLLDGGRAYRYSAVGVHYGTEIRQYDIGVLVIDIYDSRTDTLIWRGRGSQVDSRHVAPERLTEKVNEMVSQILSQFPPL